MATLFIKWIRLLLLITGLLWVGHSAWIFIDPTHLTYIGFNIPNWSIMVEIQATFGLFTSTFGLFSLLGAMFPKRYLYSAVMLWTLLYPAAALGRFVALMMYGETFAVNAGLPESYNAIMLFFFEIPFSVLYLAAYRYLRREAI